MKTKREELISLLNFLGKSKDQINQALKTFDSEQGKINDPAKDANVGSNNTASDSVNGLSDLINTYRAFQPNEQQALAIEQQSKKEVDSLFEIYDAGLPEKTFQQTVTFPSKFSLNTPTYSQKLSSDYLQKQTKFNNAKKSLDSLRQDAINSIVTSNYFKTGENLKPDTKAVSYTHLTLPTNREV